MNRQAAIEELINTPDRIALVIPMNVGGITTKAWATINVSKLTPEQIGFMKNNSCVEIAEKSDIFDCLNCGEAIAIFEDVCPNCGKFPHPQLEEVEEVGGANG